MPMSTIPRYNASMLGEQVTTTLRNVVTLSVPFRSSVNWKQLPWCHCLFLVLLLIHLTFFNSSHVVRVKSGYSELFAKVQLDKFIMFTKMVIIRAQKYNSHNV